MWQLSIGEISREAVKPPLNVQFVGFSWTQENLLADMEYNNHYPNVLGRF